MVRRVAAALVLSSPFALGCMRFHLVYPKKAPDGVTTWTSEVERDALLIRLVWAAPPGPGPFPTVLVHPDAGHESRHMRGVVWSLAENGYLAVAADYRRKVDGTHEKNLFPWREDSDVTAALEWIRADPRVDRSRIATLGFSRGGVFSLLIAARDPGVRTVVAYYPVTDFRHWLEREQPTAMRRFVWRRIESYFRDQSGAKTEEEFQQMLSRASALEQADSIRVPVLLVHGDRDTTAPIEESERLAERLRSLGREVALLVIPGAGHVFNFEDETEAREAWDATLAWIARYLGQPRAPVVPPAPEIRQAHDQKGTRDDGHPRDVVARDVGVHDRKGREHEAPDPLPPPRDRHDPQEHEHRGDMNDEVGKPRGIQGEEAEKQADEDREDPRQPNVHLRTSTCDSVSVRVARKRDRFRPISLPASGA